MDGVKTDKIRVLTTKDEYLHQGVVTELEECLADVKANPRIKTVIVCMEDRAGNLTTRWTGYDDRALFGSRLVLAGIRRMGFKTGE